MRTTLTLEPDVAARLKRTQKRRHIAWKDLINETLRNGLSQEGQNDDKRENEQFQTREVDLGQCRYENVDKVADILALADGENHR